MKNGRHHPRFKPLALFLACWLIALPALAQTQPDYSPYIAGEAQAKADVSAFLWIGAGCLFSLLGVLIGYLAPLNKAPAQALAGKSPEYVRAYTAAYESKVKKIQGGNALIGCTINGLLFLLYSWVISNPNV